MTSKGVRAMLLLSDLVGGLAASAETVQSFDGTRCYSGAYQYYLTGDGMVGPYTQLLSHSYTVLSTGAITAASLDPACVFVTGTMMPGSTLSSAEASDLQAWVAAGHGLLFFGDNNAWTATNNQFAALFGGPTYGGEYGGGGVNLTLVNTSHPVLNGPYGQVTAVGGMNVPGRWLPGAGHTPLGLLPDGSAGMVAFGYGAGRVLFVDDTNYFAYPPTYTTEHAKLWDNAIDWLWVPEPGGLLALVLAGAALLRRVR